MLTFCFNNIILNGLGFICNGLLKKEWTIASFTK